MKYYVMYEDVENDYNLKVNVCYSSKAVTTLTESLINNHGYRLTDFKVMYGTELSLRAAHAPIKVLLTS